ncbi:cytochrome P450 4c3-like [Ornithodoros turicata]|uniref:cytochrome P450 4c3-like n=1 Tax=Ornithodoros turicata TaxID=34597 RepID=UPI003138E9D5
MAVIATSRMLGIASIPWTTTLASICTVVLTGMLLINIKSILRWCRIYWYLRNVPRPFKQWSFFTVLDMWNSMSKMDGDLSYTAKAFKYFKMMFENAMHEDVSVMYFGTTPMLMGYSPDAVEGILSKNENQNKPFLYQFMAPWNGDGILTLETSLWRIRRKAFTPAFHFKILDEYVPVMNRRANALAHKLRLQEDYVDVLPVVRTAGLGIFYETALNVKVDEEKEVEQHFLLGAMEEIGAKIVSRMLNPLLWYDFLYNLTNDAKQFYHYARHLREYNTEVMCRKIEEYNAGGKEENKDSNRFIDIMMRMLKEDHSLRDVDVVDELVAAFIGGFETTAISTSFVLHLLGSHPEAQRKVHEELDAVFGDGPDGSVSHEDIKQLKYMDCVVKEALRLYPPLPIIAREFQTDTQIGKYTIPSGTVGLVMIYFLHRNPNVYESPDDFIPERFLDNKDRHPYAFVPFAGGLRNCIGQKYAKTEEKILLTHLLRQFKVESETPTKSLTIDMQLMLKTTEQLRVKFIPRKSQ